MSEAFRKLMAARQPVPTAITVPVGVMSLHFQLYGVSDLKEKRRVFAPMRSIWGKQPEVAVAESGDFDALDSAVWSVVTVGGTPSEINARLDQIEKAIAQHIDAPVLEVHREIL
ncbi:MAG: DUF503 domain-containing protein [Pseudomonadota bacterium]|uniref:DUF503 domain-containing protein n=1 Tax=Pseudohongiella sp. O18 TaxID=2904248 RepID=UPI001F1B7742|nr:DUF503 domain-containing protein [Pseudohongiella sp. O18]MEC8861079.1 DUF503 domain-containing protein [Pseudomonadota bacterium]